MRVEIGIEGRVDDPHAAAELLQDPLAREGLVFHHMPPLRWGDGLSRRGFVRTKKHLDIGHPYWTPLLAPGERRRDRLRRHGAGQSPFGQGMGVEFTSLTSFDHERVNTAVRRFRSGRPLTSVPRVGEGREGV